MKIRGSKTEKVEVDLSPMELFNALEKEYGIYPDYVDIYTKTYNVYEYTHPHNGDMVYNRRPATESELELAKAFEVLHNRINDH